LGLIYPSRLVSSGDATDSPGSADDGAPTFLGAPVATPSADIALDDGTDALAATSPSIGVTQSLGAPSAFVASNYTATVLIDSQPALIDGDVPVVTSLAFDTFATSSFELSTDATASGLSTPESSADTAIGIADFLEPYTLETGVLSGHKWGTSPILGTPGGVVTWSLVSNGTGIAGALGGGTETALSNFLYGSFETDLRAAFAAWSAVANINFIEVTDPPNSLIGIATYPDIRIGGAYIDGAGTMLAGTFTLEGDPVSGEIVFDTADASFFDAHSFFLVATHEIGHAIGLDHNEFDPNVLMYPYYNGALSGPMADDIAGAQAIYGAAQPGAAKVYNFQSDQTSLAVTYGLANLTINGNSLNNSITGTNLDETINGGDGNDTLNGGGGTFGGGGGSDLLAGGAGDDVYLINNVGMTVVENPGEGTDKVIANYISYTLGANVENLELRGYGVGTGNDGDNWITAYDFGNLLIGLGGNDTLQGGPGQCTMVGGLGDDVYRVLTANDVIVENAGEGSDTVQSWATAYTLGANLENLVFLNALQSSTGTGNGLDNVLTGNKGNDTLDGGAGADTMIGGVGNDTYIVDNAGDVITEGTGAGIDSVLSSVSYTLATNVENITLTGSADINATGNASNNILTGNSGANILTGGAGNDTYVVDHAGVAIVENSNEGTDLVQSSVSYTLSANVENLTLTGSSMINGTGNSSNNAITGNAAANVLDGGAGADTLDGGVGIDTMIGGAGDDTFIVDNPADVVTENPGEGTDSVQSTISWTLGANLENLTLTRALIAGTGNALDNRLEGLSWGETLVGGAGNDTYVVYMSDAVIVENAGEGIDTLESHNVLATLPDNVENLTMVTNTINAVTAKGNALDNVIIGSTGANYIDGGAGADTMTGGNLTNIYVVDNVGDVVIAGTGSVYEAVLSSVSYTLGTGIKDLTLTADGLAGTGNSLANTLTTGGANDTLAGGLGNDTYVLGANAGTTVIENASEGTDTVQVGASYTLGANIENLTLTAAGLIGTGNALNNVLTAGGANDTLVGGLGNDTYVIGTNTGVVAVENGGEGTDTIQVAVSFTLGGNIENLTLTGTANIDGTGDSGNNLITGNSGNNVLDGGTGADTLVGGTGSDTYIVDNVGDVVTENAGEGIDTVLSSVNFTLSSALENLTLTAAGLTGTGNSLANVITANADNDTLVGGGGNDTYVITAGVSGTVITDSSGTDTVQSAVTYTLDLNLENLTLTGASAIDGTGNNLANSITGNAAANVLDGGAGADTMTGGLGDDTYVVDNVGDLVVEGAAAGTDTIRASINYSLNSNLENLTLTAIGLIGTGNSLANVMTANANNDTLTGGLGDDTYVIAAGVTGTVINESAGQGTDTVQSAANYTLGSNLENITLTAAFIFGVGNSGANILTANASNDTLSGGAGNDTYVIAAGVTGTVINENAGEGTDTVQSAVTYTLGANLENLVLTGAVAIDGTGNSLNNVLTGNSAANTLDGGTGADTMIGGAGNDTYIIDSASDVIVENANEGSDTLQVAFSYTLTIANVENVTLTGVAPINATGNSLNNVLTGNAAANTLDGGTGADTLIGGAGDDIYYVDNAGDVVTENGGGGNDWIYTTLANYTLPNNVEIVTLNGIGPANAYGDAGDNVMFGNIWNNYFDGGTGADFMAGGMGDDAYWVDNASDVVYEKPGEGGDTIVTVINYQLFAGSDVEAIVMLDQGGNINAVGSDFDNLIQGNNFDNVIVGRGGNDRLWGFAGADRFIFQTGDGHDTIYDYNHAVQGDYLDIRVAGYTTAAQILAAAHDDGTDTTITFNANDSIKLTGVLVAQLNASDFLIIPP